MVSRPFLKREVAKCRWLFLLDLESTLRFHFLNLRQYEATEGQRGWTELERKSVEVIARRNYILNEGLQRTLKSKKAKDARNASDDGTDFNESHSWLNICQVLSGLTWEYTKHCSEEVWDSNWATPKEQSLSEGDTRTTSYQPKLPKNH